MTVTLHLEAESPLQLIDDIKSMFNLVERQEITSVLSSAPAKDITTDDLRAQLAETDAAPQEPAPKKRAKKGDTAAVKAATVGEAPTDPAPSPAFLEQNTETKAEEPAAEMSIDDMRAAAQKLAEAKGMKAVADILGTFKTADGSTVAKMSQVQPAERAAAAAKFEAAAKD